MSETERYLNVILDGGVVHLADGTTLDGVNLRDVQRPRFYGRDRYGRDVVYQDGEELVGPYYHKGQSHV